jgi:hypothetical protein
LFKKKRFGAITLFFQSSSAAFFSKHMLEI